MPKRHFNPPLNKRLVKTQDGYDIYTVNSFAIRNAAEPDEEFDNIAIHNDFPDLIPESQIWTYDATYKREGKYFLTNAIAELKSLESGKSKDDAYEAGLKAERQLREKTTGIKYRNGRPHRRVPPEIYKNKYCVIPDRQTPIRVWRVDGCLVRCLYKTDYTEGGHGYVYPWCPKEEIWVEESISNEELPYIIAHEYIEIRLMRDKQLDYNHAHTLAAEMEYDLRKASSRSDFPGLSRHVLDKSHLSALTTPEYFNYVEKHYVRSILRRLRRLASEISSQIMS